MDALVRREHLETVENPNTRLDYVISLSGDIAGLCRVDLRYVPDRVILAPESLTIYFERLQSVQWARLENVAVAMVSDLNNELVPRWVQLKVSGRTDGLEHHVTLEDRQPKWDNPALLARIGAL